MGATLNVPSGVNPGGVLGSGPTNFFPCPGPHIGGPRLNFHKIKCIIKLPSSVSDQRVTTLHVYLLSQ